MSELNSRPKTIIFFNSMEKCEDVLKRVKEIVEQVGWISERQIYNLSTDNKSEKGSHNYILLYTGSLKIKQKDDKYYIDYPPFVRKW